jgi:hypothetical protein
MHEAYKARDEAERKAKEKYLTLRIPIGHEATPDVISFKRDHSKPGNAAVQFEEALRAIVEEEVFKRLAAQNGSSQH